MSPEMTSRRIYTKYKVIVHALGLKQLDVYRVSGGRGAARDVLRILDPLSNKVAVIDLGAVREALSFTEFLDKVIEGLKNSGINVSERRVAAAREKAKAMDEAVSAKARQAA